MSELKAMSIRQPWAYSVCVGSKTVENKAKKTTYRGPLVIHASAQKADLSHVAREVGKQNVPTQLFAFGAAIGIVDLVDVVEMNRSLEGNRSANGPMCWILANARMFSGPIPMKGQLGIFTITGPEAHRVQRAIQSAKAIKAPQPFLDFLSAWEQHGRHQRMTNLTLIYLDMSRFDDVLRLVDDAIRNSSNDAFLYGARGWAKFRSIELEDGADDATYFAEVDKALPDLDKAISLDPKQALFRHWRAQVYHFRGKPDRSEADIALGRKLDPAMDWDALEGFLAESEINDQGSMPDDDEEDD